MIFPSIATPVIKEAFVNTYSKEALETEEREEVAENKKEEKEKKQTENENKIKLEYHVSSTHDKASDFLHIWFVVNDKKGEVSSLKMKIKGDNGEYILDDLLATHRMKNNLEWNWDLNAEEERLTWLCQGNTN